MKPFEQQTYYELLEVPVSAPAEDIRAAYSRLMELYAPDSIAVYALVDPEQVDSLRARMTEAVEILTDADLRAEYDKDLGLPVRRMVETVAAGGRPSAEPTVGTGAVARAAEALASTAALSVAGQGTAAATGPASAPALESPVAAAREESKPDETSASPSSESAPGPVDFRATFFRGFSFAYVSSSLQDTQLMGSSVYVPSARPATSSAETRPAPAGDAGAAASTVPAPAVTTATAPSTSSAQAVATASAPPAAPETSVSVAPAKEEARPAEPVATEPARPTVAVATEPAQAPAPVTTVTEPASAPAPAATAPESAPAPAPVASPPEPARAAEPASTALAVVPARSTTAQPPPVPSRAASHTQPPPLPTSSDPARQARPGRQLGDAQVLSQDSAIATAEAALAQVAARVRDPQPRPRSPDIPADAEFNGELLRRVREARGQSLQQVADRTRISKGHLENVEADRYNALPPPVYLRGILMNLARELGLDPLRVSRSYLALASEKSGKK
jgi:hypothetical protein